eukprot:197530_1
MGNSKSKNIERKDKTSEKNWTKWKCSYCKVDRGNIIQFDKKGPIKCKECHHSPGYIDLSYKHDILVIKKIYDELLTFNRREVKYNNQSSSILTTLDKREYVDAIVHMNMDALLYELSITTASDQKQILEELIRILTQLFKDLSDEQKNGVKFDLKPLQHRFNDKDIFFRVLHQAGFMESYDDNLAFVLSAKKEAKYVFDRIQAAYTEFKNSTNIEIDTGLSYSVPLIHQLMSLQLGTKLEIMKAMDCVVNRNDINELMEHLQSNNDEKQQSTANGLKTDTETSKHSEKKIEHEMDLSYVLKPYYRQPIDRCDISKCITVRNVVKGLKNYQLFIEQNETKNNNADYVYDSLCLLNDQFHLLQCHHGEFYDIYDILTKEYSYKTCEMKNCYIMKRNHRNKIQQRNQTDFNKLYFDANEINDIVKQQIFDKIHCYYCHSIDTGYKLSSKKK